MTMAMPWPPRAAIAARTTGSRWSLGARLRDQGPLGYDQLERFGNELFQTLDALAARGVRHRDVKPDNLGLFKRSDGSRQLMLFDFSLADAPDQDVHAGTRGYLDPFLGGTGRSPVRRPRRVVRRGRHAARDGVG